MEKLMEAIPGNGGEPNEGPGSWEDMQFERLAYPGTDIPLSSLEAERAAANALRSSGFARGKGRSGTWVSVGPTEALYPFTDLRNSYSYVPNDYVAGGRTVALAISPTCKPGNCTMWVGPAGGGIWRTKNALDGQPNWTYLVRAIRHQRHRLDRPGSQRSHRQDAVGGHRRSQRLRLAAAWLASACTSPPMAATPGRALGHARFNARGVGSIVVKPGDSNTIYAASTRAGRGMSSVATGGVVTIVPGAPKWGLYKSTDGGATWTFIHNGAATVAGCTGDTTEAGNGTPCSPRGVRQVVLDPTDPNTVYAGSFARGVWRSNDGGATWTQIKPPLVTLRQ